MGAGLFLMSEVALYFIFKCPASAPHMPYRGTSIIRKRLPLRPYSRASLWPYDGPMGEGVFL